MIGEYSFSMYEVQLMAVNVNGYVRSIAASTPMTYLLGASVDEVCVNFLGGVLYLGTYPSWLFELFIFSQHKELIC
jgi:hypothetical protein